MMKTEGLEHQIVLMPNLLSLYGANGGIEAAAEQMADMVEQGFMGIFAHLPCVPFRAAPRGEPGEHSAGRPHALQDSQVRACRASGSAAFPGERSLARWGR